VDQRRTVNEEAPLFRSLLDGELGGMSPFQPTSPRPIGHLGGRWSRGTSATHYPVAAVRKQFETEQNPRRPLEVAFN
jgi:hypothetical protein